MSAVAPVTRSRNLNEGLAVVFFGGSDESGFGH